MENEIESVNNTENASINGKKDRRRKKNKIVTEIIDESTINNEEFMDILNEKIKQALTEVLSEKKKEIFELSKDNTKVTNVTKIIDRPRGVARIRSVNVQMPVVSKFKQFKSRKKSSGIATTFTIHAR